MTRSNKDTSVDQSKRLQKISRLVGANKKDCCNMKNKTIYALLLSFLVVVVAAWAQIKIPTGPIPQVPREPKVEPAQPGAEAATPTPTPVR